MHFLIKSIVSLFFSQSLFHHRLLQMAAQVEAEPEVSAYIHFIISLVNFLKFYRCSEI